MSAAPNGHVPALPSASRPITSTSSSATSAGVVTAVGRQPNRASCSDVRPAGSKTPHRDRVAIGSGRGKKVSEALNTLGFLPSPSARIVAKVVKSAIANAENNYHMSPGRLRIVQAYVNEGQRLKRFHAGARGRVSPYCHRFSHITVIVEED